MQHAELLLGDAIVILGQHSDEGWMEGAAPDALASTISLYVVVDYGSREYSARDLEGNLWSFGTYDPAA